MGLLSGLLGNASEADSGKTEELLADSLIEGEVIEKAYQVIRDMFVFII